MNTLCSQELLERSLAGSLGADDEVALSQHLDECEMCSAELERLAGGESKCREIATLLTPDDLDDAVARREECSMADFVVEHLEPADDSSVLGRIGPYDVLEIIGRGGMGIVLKGFDRELKRFVAIKALAPHLAHSALARKRFSREAQAAAAVVDLHVIAIHHVQSSGHLPFLVMPLLNGESLAARIKARGSLELTEVLRIGMQAALGLAAAHAQGLVHRDVKPANILLEKGVERAVLTDFGLARAGDDVSMTRWGIIAGTPEYMSPEQARGAALDARSDLFSLGCVLYEMATGVSPFRAESTMATLRRIVDDKPTALASLAPNLPPWFIAIVERLLAKEPAERFATAREVSELLEQCLSHLQQPTTLPLPIAVKTRTSRHRGRPPLARWLAAGAASFILLLAGVMVVLELNKGELTIECSAKEVPVRILQGDAVVKKMTVTTAGTTLRVAAGKYVVEIDGGHDDLIVQGGGVTLKRGGVETVRITHKEAQSRAKQENEQFRKENPNAVTVPEADPREKLSTLIPEAIRILEAKEYSTFLKNFVSPTEFRELTLKTGLDQSAFAKQFGDKRAPQLLLILKSLSDAKLTLDPTGMIVTYELPESIGRRNTLSFHKIDKYWYMLNKVDEPAIPKHTVVPKGALERPASSLESKRSRDASVANMKQILLALQKYHAVHRRFPPAVLYGKDGKGEVPHSWRVAILPYLDNGAALYSEYQFEEPWDSEANKRVLAQMPAAFRHPSAPPKSTNSACYVIVGKPTDTGVPTAFSNKAGMALRDILDGASSTIAVVETNLVVPWTKPDDVLYDSAEGSLTLGGHYEDDGHYPDGFYIGSFAGGVHFLPTNTSQDLLRAYLSPAGGEKVAAFASAEYTIGTEASQLMKRKLREFRAIDAAHRLIEELSQMGMAGIVQIVVDEKTNSIEASGDSAALKFVGEYLDRIESEAASSKDSGEQPSGSDQPAKAMSDQVEDPANGLPTPEAAADALIRAYATRDYELFLKARLRTVCETNDKDGPSKYADALHFSQLMRGKDQLTVYDLKRRLKPDSIRALAANSSRELTRAIETALQFYGEEYRYVDVTSDGFDGSQYVIRVIVARNGNQWHAIPHGYSSENAYKAVDAFAQAKEEAPAK